MDWECLFHIKLYLFTLRDAARLDICNKHHIKYLKPFPIWSIFIVTNTHSTDGHRLRKQDHVNLYASHSIKLIKLCVCACVCDLVEHMLWEQLSHLAQSQAFPPTADLHYLTERGVLFPWQGGHKWRNIIEIIICMETQIWADISAAAQGNPRGCAGGDGEGVGC